MGMIVAPARYGSGVAPGTFLVGNNAALTGNIGIVSDFQQGPPGSAAVASGTANTLWCRGSSATDAPAHVFRLCLWSAAAANGPWTLLSYTADITGLPQNGTASGALLVPQTITNGSLYAVAIHCSTTGIAGKGMGATAGTERAAADTFSDGPVSSIASTFENSASAMPCIWAST